jgi:acyl-CoA synthetase (AMP-forming)/AMP-acid ligase II
VRYEDPSVTLMDYSMSYSHPADQTAAVAAALTELGVRPAERVLIMLPDGPARRGLRRHDPSRSGATASESTAPSAWHCVSRG